jgi:hypothetical protein
MSENNKTDPSSRLDSGVKQGENTTPEGARAGSGSVTGLDDVKPTRGPKEPPPDPPAKHSTKRST